MTDAAAIRAAPAAIRSGVRAHPRAAAAGTISMAEISSDPTTRIASATTTVRGRVLRGADMRQLPRVPVLRATGFLQLAQKLFTAYEERRAQRG